MVAALRVSALRAGTLPVTVEASLASLTPLRVPVSASAVVVAIPRIPRTETRAALASPTTVVVLVVGDGNSPPSWARLAPGHANIPASTTAIATDSVQRCFLCFISNLHSLTPYG